MNQNALCLYQRPPADSSSLIFETQIFICNFGCFWWFRFRCRGGFLYDLFCPPKGTQFLRRASKVPGAVRTSQNIRFPGRPQIKQNTKIVLSDGEASLARGTCGGYKLGYKSGYTGACPNLGPAGRPTCGVWGGYANSKAKIPARLQSGM